MTDNQLIQLFLPIIRTGLIAQGYPDVIVKQSYQPTLQGANTGATVYFYKSNEDTLFGFPAKVQVNDVLTTTQQYFSKFRVMAWVKQNPATPAAYTASDLLNVVAGVIQDSPSIQTLIAAGVGILEVDNTQNPIFVDDMDEFEYASWFEFTLTYSRQTVTTGLPYTSTVVADFNGVP